MPGSFNEGCSFKPVIYLSEPATLGKGGDFLNGECLSPRLGR
jgi:hypothetical protein